MLTHLQKHFLALKTLIEQRQYHNLAGFSMDVSEQLKVDLTETINCSVAAQFRDSQYLKNPE